MENLYFYIGPPGCGKTETLKGSVEKNAMAYGRDKVVCCSLTVNAANVLKGRVELPKGNVGTLHSICYRALGCPKLTVKHEKEFCPGGFYELSSGQRDLDDPVSFAPGGTQGDQFRYAMEIHRAHCSPRWEWSAGAVEFDKQWKAWKKANDLMDFTDLLETCLNDFETCPGLPMVLIGDEAQDWSRLALSLLLKWGRSALKVILAADPNQAIFRFAGADPRNLLELPVVEEHQHVLGQSYRLPVEVHRLAQEWLGRALVRSDAAFAPRIDPAGVPVPGEVRHVPFTLRDNLEYVIEQAAMTADASKTVMLLASCDYMVAQIVSVLRGMGVPFHNPLRPKDGSWNPLRQGGSADRVRAFLSPATGRPWTKAEAASFLEVLPAEGHWAKGMKGCTLREWKQDASLCAVDDLRGVLEPNLVNRLCDLADGLNGQKGIQEAMGWLQKASAGQFAGKLNYAASVASRRGPGALEEEPRILVGTIHSAKGGEVDEVILFPDLSPVAYRQWEDGGDGRDDIVRCFYVGMTRARETLTVCGASSPCHVDLPW